MPQQEPTSHARHSRETFPREHEAQNDADETVPAGTCLVATVKLDDNRFGWLAFESPGSISNSAGGWLTTVRTAQGTWTSIPTHELALELLGVELGIVAVRRELLHRVGNVDDNRVFSLAAELAHVLTALRAEREAILDSLA